LLTVINSSNLSTNKPAGIRLHVSLNTHFQASCVSSNKPRSLAKSGFSRTSVNMSTCKVKFPKKSQGGCAKSRTESSPNQG
jgi:hypothetical protein